MSYLSLTAAQVAAKAPLDDTLLGTIATDLDDLNSRVTSATAKPFLLEVNGRLTYMSTFKRSVAAGILNLAFQPTLCRYMLKKSGTSGNLNFDLRTQSSPKSAIAGISFLYTAATQSIARQGSSLSTQSIARNAAQISTQSISFAHAAQNITSIILLGQVDALNTANAVQYNLSAAISADTKIGDSIVCASATTSANNGTFTIIDVNRGGGNNVVISNASGVAQLGAVGTCQEPILSYNYTNPVDTVNFAAGFSHTFASHTTSANNGTLLVYSVNQSGNSVWVKNATGVVQAGVAGTLDTNFWKFAFTGAASSDYAVGQAAFTASHTSGGNNAAALTIVAVNSSGNNVILYNTAGVAQGSAAGTVNTNRWSYALPSDPTASSNVIVGDTVNLLLHTNAANNGVFTVQSLTTSTVVVYNLSGVAQASTPGTVNTTKKTVSFATDQSAFFTTASFIEMVGCADSTYNYFYQNSPFQVLQINRGGGANFNVVINSNLGTAQANPAGYVQNEMRSIFTATPNLASNVTAIEANSNIAGTSNSFVTQTIADNTPLLLYLLSVPSGDPRDLSVSLI